jgi:hypothetical protein
MVGRIAEKTPISPEFAIGVVGSQRFSQMRSEHSRFGAPNVSFSDNYVKRCIVLDFTFEEGKGKIVTVAVVYRSTALTDQTKFQ